MDSSPRSALVIRPMGVGGVLDVGMGVARRNYNVLVRTAAYAVVPAFVIGAILALVTNTTGILSFLIFIGTSLGGIALVIACAHEIAPTGQINELEPEALYGATWSRVGRAILYTIVAIVLALTFVIPPLGIYLWVRWAAAWNALLIEGIGPIAAYGRSWALTRGSWWHSLGVIVVAFVVYLLGYFVVGLVFGVVGTVLVAAGSLVLGTVVSSLGNSLGAIFVLPFVTAISVVLYYELRARSEGLDLLTRTDAPPAS